MLNKFYLEMNKELLKDNVKLCLSYCGLMNQNELFDLLNDDKKGENKIINPFYKLIENYESIKLILKHKELNIMEYLYMNRAQIHYILYDYDESIYINNDSINKFADYYYLYFLIKDECTINYKYKIEFIYKLYDEILTAGGALKKIILSKILLVLIDNFYEFSEVDLDKCEYIKDKTDEYINNAKNYLNKYIIYNDLNEIKIPDIELDELYCKIIVSLIRNNKLEYKLETIDILYELDIINLRLNKTILNGLLQVLVEDNLKPYLIFSYDDLFIKNKIFFYYILFKYILKSSDYTFHIPFLFKTRKKIIEVIDEHINQFEDDLKEEVEKFINLQNVLVYFIDLEYYINKSKLSHPNRSKDSSNSSDDLISNNSISDLSLKYRSPSSSWSFGKDDIEGNYDDFEITDYNFMSESSFTIRVDYKKGENEAIVKYKKIICKEKEFKIEDVKSYKSEDEVFNMHYKKFIKFLEIVEKELKSKYKREKEIEIDLKFNLQFCDIKFVNCNYIINDDNLKDNFFMDSNILDKINQYYDGLSSMILAISKS